MSTSTTRFSQTDTLCADRPESEHADILARYVSRFCDILESDDAVESYDIHVDTHGVSESITWDGDANHEDTHDRLAEKAWHTA